MGSDHAMTRRDFVFGTAATAGVASLFPLKPLDASAAQGTVTDDQAREIYRRAIVIDGLASPAQMQLDDVARSGLTAVNVTVVGGNNNTFQGTVRRLGRWMGRIEAHPSQLTLIRKHADLGRAKRDGKLGLILGFQNADMLSADLRDLETFQQLGVRIIQVTYDIRNLFGDGCVEPANGGLSTLGRELVARMNELGVVVDLSHCGDQTTADGIAASSKPVILSHTGCKEVYRRNPRNKEDRELRAMADRGGVVGIYLIADGLGGTTEEWLLRHIEHALQVCGTDHVGIGSDLSITPIEETPEYLQEKQELIAYLKEVGRPAAIETFYLPPLNHPRRLESIAIALARRGHSSAVLENVIGGNFSRVFHEIWGS